MILLPERALRQYHTRHVQYLSVSVGKGGSEWTHSSTTTGLVIFDSTFHRQYWRWSQPSAGKHRCYARWCLFDCIGLELPATQLVKQKRKSSGQYLHSAKERDELWKTLLIRRSSNIKARPPKVRMTEIPSFGLLRQCRDGTLGGRLAYDVDISPGFPVLPCGLLKDLSTGKKVKIVRRWLEEYVEPFLMRDMKVPSFRDWNRLMSYYWSRLEKKAGQKMVLVTIPRTAGTPRYRFSSPMLFASYAGQMKVACRLTPLGGCQTCRTSDVAWCEDSFFDRIPSFDLLARIHSEREFDGWSDQKLQAWAIASSFISIDILDRMSDHHNRDNEGVGSFGDRLLDRYGKSLRDFICSEGSSEHVT